MIVLAPAGRTGASAKPGAFLQLKPRQNKRLAAHSIPDGSGIRDARLAFYIALLQRGETLFEAPYGLLRGSPVKPW
jgi:hypothetical protein